MNRYLRLLPIILSVCAFGVGALGAAIAFKGLDIETIITGTYAKQVTVAELQEGKVKPVLLIDVRSPKEYAEDRIGKSPLIPITDIETGKGIERVKAIVEKSDRSKTTVILYCTSGKRSTKAYRLLEKEGLNMAVLSGGIDAWREAVPAEKDGDILAPIVPTKKANSSTIAAPN